MKNVFPLIIFFLLFFLSTCAQTGGSVSDVSNGENLGNTEIPPIGYATYSRDIVLPYVEGEEREAALRIDPDFLFQVKENPSDNFQLLVETLIDGTEDPFEQARIFWDWISLNIVYDYDSYTNGVFPSMDRNTTLSRGMALCSGFSILYRDMCLLAGIPAIYVDGLARFGTSPDIESSLEAHAWNLIYIQNNWYCIDVTGYNIPNYGFFLTEPLTFRSSHFPQSAGYPYEIEASSSDLQLCESPLDFEEWLNSPLFLCDTLISDTFVDIRPLVLVTPVVEGNFSFHWQGAPQGLWASYALRDRSDFMIPYERNETFFVEKKDSGVYVTVHYPYAAEWQVEISIRNNEGDYLETGVFIVNSLGRSESFFPYVTDHAIKNDFSLISPLNTPLSLNDEIEIVFEIPSNLDSEIFNPFVLDENGQTVSVISTLKDENDPRIFRIRLNVPESEVIQVGYISGGTSPVLYVFPISPYDLTLYLNL